MAAHNRIQLKCYGNNEWEALVGGTITPGHLIKRNSAGALVVHATAGGQAEKLFAIEDQLQGHSIADNYASGARAFAYNAQRGDIIAGLITAGEDFLVGQQLESAGDGTFRKLISGKALAVALEDPDAAVVAAGTDKGSVTCATTAALPACTYDNGSLGVGATLTADVAAALPAIDGVTMTLSQEVLVQDQAAPANNGIYQLSTLGVTEVAASPSGVLTYGSPSPTDTVIFTDLPNESATPVTFTAVATPAAAQPSGTITFGSPSNDDTVVFTNLPNESATPVTFTKKATAGTNEFETIAELTALINAETDLTATDNGTVITIVGVTIGTAMNSATVTGTGSWSALSLTFSGGVAAVGADEFSNIAELTALIHAETDLTATNDGTDITIVNVTAGTAMNSAVGSGTGAYSALNITFSGGVDAVAWVLTRATDNDLAAEQVGAYCSITSGTTLGSERARCSLSAAPVMGTGAITWVPFTGAVSGTTYPIQIL